MFAFLKEVKDRIHFWKTEDKIGPDFPWTHWRLHFPSTMVKLCQQKFMHFDETAQFRPYAYARVCSQISIGKRVVVRPNTFLCASPKEFGGSGKIIIEDDVLLANGIQMHTDHHLYEKRDVPIYDQGYAIPKDIILRKGSWIGANVVIVGGVTVGENAVVGAGSVVTKDVPANCVVGGVPAQVIKEIYKNEDRMVDRQFKPLRDPVSR